MVFGHGGDGALHLKAYIEHKSIPVDKNQAACYAVKLAKKEQENNTIS